ncbi:MAG TPA: hypothetical protein VFS40_07755 [Gemmatimonadales bacterium]|nr:hypothetical protein [Gemmatimonadales bacterium]
MRFFRGIIASMAVVGVLACGGDKTGPDEGSGGTGTTLSGTYKLKSVAGQSLPIEDPESGSSLDSGSAAFTTDGNVTVKFNFTGEADESYTGTYVRNDADVTVTLDDAGETFELPGTVSNNGNRITIDLGGAPLVFEK